MIARRPRIYFSNVVRFRVPVSPAFVSASYSGNHNVRVTLCWCEQRIRSNARGAKNSKTQWIVRFLHSGGFH